MLADMQDYDTIFWVLYGAMPVRKRLRKLRTLRAQCELDLTDAEAQVTALRHRLLLIDNAVSDYMLGGKQRGRE